METITTLMVVDLGARVVDWGADNIFTDAVKKIMRLVVVDSHVRVVDCGVRVADHDPHEALHEGHENVVGAPVDDTQRRFAECGAAVRASGDGDVVGDRGDGVDGATVGDRELRKGEPTAALADTAATSACTRARISVSSAETVGPSPRRWPGPSALAAASPPTHAASALGPGLRLSEAIDD